MDKATTVTIGFGDKLQATANMAMSLSMAFNTMKGLSDVWSNEDMSIGEKMLSTITSLAMVLPMVTSAMQAENVARILGIGLKTKDGIITSIDSKNRLVNAIATGV
jgi:hypothetical protein